MNFSRKDLPYLKPSLLIFLCVIAAGGGAILTANNKVELARAERQLAQLELNRMRGRLNAAAIDQKNLAAFTVEYRELLKKNVIGNERRLDWIESLEALRKQQPVQDFKYTISPQHAYLLPATWDTGNFKLYMSDMTMQFELLHEEQLVNFLDSLRGNSGGWFIPDHCAMERLADLSGGTRLKAECSGGWLTLQLRSTK